MPRIIAVPEKFRAEFDMILGAVVGKVTGDVYDHIKARLKQKNIPHEEKNVASKSHVPAGHAYWSKDQVPS